jgi:hypothetical protein
MKPSEISTRDLSLPFSVPWPHCPWLYPNSLPTSLPASAPPAEFSAERAFPGTLRP